VGHHAQYRKRCSEGYGNPHLQPPLRPFQLLYDTGINIFPQGEDNTGGTFRTYRSSDGNDPWTFQIAKAWGHPVPVTGAELGKPGYYRTTEVGNHTAYEGESEPSTVLHVV
jgi:hypothetical protein